MEPNTPALLQSLFQSPTVSIVVGLVTIAIITRILTAQSSKVLDSNGGPVSVPAVPYWLPIIGHIPSMAVDAENFVRRLRDTYLNGIFALNFGGQRHNILYTPGLVTALLNQKSSNADSEGVGRHLMVTTFGFPKEELDHYDDGVGDLVALYKLLLTEPSLGDMVTRTAKKTRENVMNLVSFNESLVDHMPWEKTSDTRIVKNTQGKEVVEASLLPLIRDFCAFSANESLMGPDFLANYPEFFDDIWALDRAFLLLVTGLPRWAPIPSLTQAHIARKRNLDRLDEFHEAMEKWSKGEDPGTKWSNLDDVGALVKARLPLYQKYNWSIRARAATEHALMWAANANSNSLVFWMVNRIYQDRALLAMLREEIAPFVPVEQPKAAGLPIAEAPQISHFDVEGLCNGCPLLKSCYIECLRLDAASWSLKIVQQDFVLQSRDKNSQAWQLRKGDYVHAAHDLHNTDPNSFEHPMVWKADRHVKYDEKKEGSADLGTIRPYGGGSSMCKGRAFAFKETMIFAAAIIAMWDIEPAGGGPWKMPKHKKASGVYNTSDTTRVWVKRRELPSKG